MYCKKIKIPGIPGKLLLYPVIAKKLHQLESRDGSSIDVQWDFKRSIKKLSRAFWSEYTQSLRKQTVIKDCLMKLLKFQMAIFYIMYIIWRIYYQMIFFSIWKDNDLYTKIFFHLLMCIIYKTRLEIYIFHFMIPDICMESLISRDIWLSFKFNKMFTIKNHKKLMLP